MSSARVRLIAHIMPPTSPQNPLETDTPSKIAPLRTLAIPAKLTDTFADIWRRILSRDDAAYPKAQRERASFHKLQGSLGEDISLEDTLEDLGISQKSLRDDLTFYMRQIGTGGEDLLPVSSILQPRKRRKRKRGARDDGGHGHLRRDQQRQSSQATVRFGLPQTDGFASSQVPPAAISAQTAGSISNRYYPIVGKGATDSPSDTPFASSPLDYLSFGKRGQKQLLNDRKTNRPQSTAKQAATMPLETAELRTPEMRDCQPHDNLADGDPQQHSGNQQEEGDFGGFDDEEMLAAEAASESISGSEGSESTLQTPGPESSPYTRDGDKTLSESARTHLPTSQFSSSLDPDRSSQSVRSRTSHLKNVKPNQAFSPSKRKWDRAEMELLIKAMADGYECFEIYTMDVLHGRTTESIRKKIARLEQTMMDSETKKPSFPKFNSTPNSWTHCHSIKLRRLYREGLKSADYWRKWFPEVSLDSLNRQVDLYTRQMQTITGRTANNAPAPGGQSNAREGPGGKDEVLDDMREGNIEPAINGNVSFAPSVVTPGASHTCSVEVDRGRDQPSDKPSRPNQLRRDSTGGVQTLLNFRRDKGKLPVRTYNVKVSELNRQHRRRPLTATNELANASKQANHADSIALSSDGEDSGVRSTESHVGETSVRATVKDSIRPTSSPARPERDRQTTSDTRPSVQLTQELETSLASEERRRSSDTAASGSDGERNRHTDEAFEPGDLLEQQLNAPYVSSSALAEPGICGNTTNTTKPNATTGDGKNVTFQDLFEHQSQVAARGDGAGEEPSAQKVVTLGRPGYEVRVVEGHAWNKNNEEIYSEAMLKAKERRHVSDCFNVLKLNLELMVARVGGDDEEILRLKSKLRQQRRERRERYGKAAARQRRPKTSPLREGDVESADEEIDRTTPPEYRHRVDAESDSDVSCIWADQEADDNSVASSLHDDGPADALWTDGLFDDCGVDAIVRGTPEAEGEMGSSGPSRKKSPRTSAGLMPTSNNHTELSEQKEREKVDDDGDCEERDGEKSDGSERNKQGNDGDAREQEMSSGLHHFWTGPPWKRMAFKEHYPSPPKRRERTPPIDMSTLMYDEDDSSGSGSSSSSED